MTDSLIGKGWCIEHYPKQIDGCETCKEFYGNQRTRGAENGTGAQEMWAARATSLIEKLEELGVRNRGVLPQGAAIDIIRNHTAAPDVNEDALFDELRKLGYSEMAASAKVSELKRLVSSPKPVSLEERAEDMQRALDNKVFELAEKACADQPDDCIAPFDKWHQEKYGYIPSCESIAPDCKRIGFEAAWHIKREVEQPDEYTWKFINDDEIIAHLQFLWQEYAMCEDDKLSEDAKELKQKLLKAIPKRKLIDLNEIKVGSVIEYRNGWLAKVFDITDIVWLGGAGKAKARARIWSRAEGREWYHTHRADGYSTTDRECDIMKILPAKGDKIEGGK